MQDIDASIWLGSQDSESDMGSDSDEKSVEMEELEDGEISQKLGNSDRRQDEVMKNGRQENSPVVNDQSEDNQEPVGGQESSPINVVENINSLHGKSMGAEHVGVINEVQSIELCEENNAFSGGPNNNSLRNNKVGPNAEVGNNGPSMAPNLGKRNREDRSPPSVGST
ncbi:hypothetical protein Hanom_Chr12g01153661 [Helianthus anomalus]